MPTERSLRKIIGSVFAAVLAFLAMADVPDQARKWQAGIIALWGAVSPFLTNRLAQWVFLIGAVVVMAWAWAPRRKWAEGRAGRPADVEVSVERQPAQQQLAPPNQPQLPDAPVVEERFFTPRTPLELLALSRTDVISTKRDALIEPHIGKWLHVEGRIDDIGKSYNGTIVRVDVPGHRIAGLTLYFDDKFSHALATLDKNDIIKADGRLHSLSALGLDLRDCELLGYEPGGPRAPTEVSSARPKTASPTGGSEEEPATGQA